MCLHISFISMAMDIPPQTSNIKAITICYIAIIAIIENSGAVKETSMLSTDVLFSLRLDLWPQKRCHSFIKSTFPFYIPHIRTPPLHLTLPPFSSPLLPLSWCCLSLSRCWPQHVFPISSVMHSSPQSDLINPHLMDPPSIAPTVADRLEVRSQGSSVGAWVG